MICLLTAAWSTAPSSLQGPVISVAILRSNLRFLERPAMEGRHMSRRLILANTVQEVLLNQMISVRTARRFQTLAKSLISLDVGR